MKKYIGLLILLAIVELCLSLYLTVWRETFWNAIAAKQATLFLTQIGVFTGVAFALCFITGMSGYLLTLTAIEWRKILDSRIRNRHIAILKKKDRLENIEQRWQSDCQEYPDLFLTIGYGIVKALIFFTVFAVALCYSFHWYYLCVLLVYSLFGTYVTKRVAMPLIALNYKTQQLEATYRKALTKKNFLSCTLMQGVMATKQKYLAHLQSFYSQAGVVIPLLLISPEYFHTHMLIGALMRFNSIGANVLDNLSYGITSFATINRLMSCRARLKEIGGVI